MVALLLHCCVLQRLFPLWWNASSFCKPVGALRAALTFKKHIYSESILSIYRVLKAMWDSADRLVNTCGAHSLTKEVCVCMCVCVCVCVCVLALSHFSRVQLFVTLWTVACQAPLSYWSRLPFPSPGYLPEPGIEHTSMCHALTGGFFTASTTWEAQQKK